MKIIETIALITINETLFIQLLSFLLLLFILNRTMIGPLRRVMGEREALVNRISQEIDATEQSYHDIEHEIAAQEKAARSEAFTIRDQIEATGQHAAEDLMSKTRAEINAFKVKAHKETDDRLAVARQEIEREAVLISEQMIQALLGRRSAS